MAPWVENDALRCIAVTASGALESVSPPSPTHSRVAFSRVSPAHALEPMRLGCAVALQPGSPAADRSLALISGAAFCPPSAYL